MSLVLVNCNLGACSLPPPLWLSGAPLTHKRRWWKSHPRSQGCARSGGISSTKGEQARGIVAGRTAVTLRGCKGESNMWQPCRLRGEFVAASPSHRREIPTSISLAKGLAGVSCADEVAYKRFLKSPWTARNILTFAILQLLQHLTFCNFAILTFAMILIFISRFLGGGGEGVVEVEERLLQAIDLL